MRNPFPRYNWRRRGSEGLQVFNGQCSRQQRAAVTAASPRTSSVAFAGAARPASPGERAGCSVGCSFVGSASPQLPLARSLTRGQPLWLSLPRHQARLSHPQSQVPGCLALAGVSSFQGAAGEQKGHQPALMAQMQENHPPPQGASWLREGLFRRSGPRWQLAPFGK